MDRQQVDTDNLKRLAQEAKDILAPGAEIIGTSDELKGGLRLYAQRVLDLIAELEELRQEKNP